MPNSIKSHYFKTIFLSVIIAFSTPTIGASDSGSTGFVKSLTRAVGDNWTVAVDTTTSPETAGLDEEARKEEERCAAGEEGSQGEAIEDAVKIHIELGSALPDVEKLFDQAGDCFSKLNKLYDLSFSIPSLSSIINSAQQAVIDYAKQKVCTAVYKASEMVTSPINQAIDKINSQHARYFDLNGLSNKLVQGGLSKIDPNLGKQYLSPPKEGEYTIPSFSEAQTTFDTDSVNTTIPNAPSSGSGNYVYNNQTQQLNELNSKLQSAQLQLPAAQRAVLLAQNRLNSCVNQGSICTNYQTQLTQAQANLNQIQQNIQTLQSQISNLSGNPVSNGLISSNANNINTPTAQNNSANSDKSGSSSSILNTMGNLFH